MKNCRPSDFDDERTFQILNETIQFCLFQVDPSNSNINVFFLRSTAFPSWISILQGFFRFRDHFEIFFIVKFPSQMLIIL